MDRISAAKVLIVEDEEEKAVDLLTALGRRGIGAAWLKGGSDPDDKPLAPLEGVRILFLDLQLANFPNETSQLVGVLLSRLRELMADRQHPLAIVVWSTRGDAQEITELMMEKWRSFFDHIAPKVVLLDKNDLDTNDLLEQIPGSLAQLGAINLLLFWEQLVADAASDTTTALSALLTETDNDLLDILKRLHQAAAPPEAVDPPDALAAVSESLNVILEDRLLRRTLESATNPVAVGGSTMSVAKSVLDERPPENKERQARLNRLLLVAPVHDAWEPRPGNIYLADSALFGGRFPISDEPDASINREQLLRHTLNIKDASQPAQVAPILAASVPILLELTPECDHAQQRMVRTRLLAGAIIEARLAKRVKGLQHVYATLPVRLDHQLLSHQDVVLVFNALMWLGLPIDDLALLRESFRLRKQQLIDVQAWFGYHANRPGVLQIDR